MFIIHKKDNLELPENYRQIYMLSTLSKVMEKTILIQLSNYMEKLNVLDSQQFGFRNGKSMVDAVNKWANNISDVSPMRWK